LDAINRNVILYRVWQYLLLIRKHLPDDDSLYRSKQFGDLLQRIKNWCVLERHLFMCNN
jgi:hypothetical protein